MPLNLILIQWICYMNKIILGDTSALCSHICDKNEKLVLQGRDLFWMTQEMIKKKTQEGIKITNSLKKIAEQIKHAEITATNKDTLTNLLFNLTFIENKITHHNNSIENNTFLNVLDKIIICFSMGFVSLKYQSITEQVRKEEQDCVQILSDTSYCDLLLKQYSLAPELLLEIPELATQLAQYLINKKYLSDEEIEIISKISSFLPEHPKVELVFKKTLKLIQDTIKNTISNKEELQKVQEILTTNQKKLSKRKPGKNPQIKLKATQMRPFSISYNQVNGDIIVNYGSLIGGGYKVLKRKMRVSSNQMLAVSKQQLPWFDPLKTKKEVEILQKLKGKPHVLQLHSAKVYHSKKKGEVQLIMTEFCDMGNLGEHRRELNGKQKLKVACDIIQGLIEVHQAGIIHRDLKLDNIFLKKIILENGKEDIEAVIGDFGVSCWNEYDSDRYLVAGSDFYMDLNLLGSYVKAASFASDIWSLGIVFAVLFEHPILGQCWLLNPLKDIIKRNENIAQELYPEPTQKESMDYVIWNLLRSKAEERMHLQEALVILKILLEKQV